MEFKLLIQSLHVIAIL